MEGLPEDVRNRFKEAREEAMKDPKIQALRDKAEAASREFRDAIRNEIASKDPNSPRNSGFSQDEGKGVQKEKKQRPDSQGEAGIQALPPAERDPLASRPRDCQAGSSRAIRRSGHEIRPVA
jgi:hypothetical protein